MPAPATVTGLTITQVDDDPTAELAWNHNGVNLDRFEVLRKATADTYWESVLLAPASDFGTGPYSCTVHSADGYDFVVRALSATGEVSV